MKTIPEALQARLDSGVTTLCHCWIVTRRDGVVQGYTDHDEDVPIGAVTCRAGTGLSGAEATAQLGLAVQGSAISGALADDSLSEADLAAGRYDAAEVATYLADWSEPELHILLARQVLGEVQREGPAFIAELRSLAHRLAEETGRLYTAACSCDLGDERCGVDLTQAEYRGTGTVTTLLGTSILRATGLDGYDIGWFTAGKLTFTSGANASVAAEVKSHRADAVGVVIELWQALPEPIAENDAFVVTAGCDKNFATCRDRFANAVNFHGFPHIPGNDFVIRYPVSGEPGNDGASLTQ